LLQLLQRPTEYLNTFGTNKFKILFNNTTNMPEHRVFGYITTNLLSVLLCLTLFSASGFQRYTY